MTAEQYCKAWDRLYIKSQRANSLEESLRIDAALTRLNARYEKAKADKGRE